MTATDGLCRSYLDLKWHFDPAAASAAGVVAEDARLGRYDAETVREHLAALRSIAGATEELEVDDLQDEIDRTALLGELRATQFRWEHERPHVRNPSLWLSHLFGGIYTLLTRTDPSAGSHAPAVLARLKEAPAFLDAARATIDEPPSVFVDTALGMLGGGGELLAHAATMLAAEAPALADELKAATTEALQALTAFGKALRDQIEPSEDPMAFAVGEEQFSRRLHFEHALRAGPPELWRYGVHLQEEVEAQLAALGRELGRPWRELVDQLRGDSPPVERLLDAYRDEINRTLDFVVANDLVTLPEGPIDVTPTPSFLAPVIPFAAYEPPPIYLSGQHARFYVTVPNASLPPETVAQQRRGHCVHGIPAIVVHEAYPGHHLQFLTARRLSSEVRRHLWTPIMVEGWALYGEQLMAEAGYYPTPEARLFQLVNLLWRAVRIVLDVGLHTRGMTPADAVQYMVDRLPIERRSAEIEVRRYCAYPTYQLCYAVGRRELLALRDAYRARAGADFSPQRFHDELLAYGGLPVALARWGMDLGE